MMETNKLKDQNVLKIFLYFIFFIFFTSYSQSDTLSGTYNALAHFQEHYKTFNFSNNTFEYNYGSSLGDEEYGTGEYKIKNELLILNFNQIDSEPKFIIETTTWKNANTLVELNIVVYNGDIPASGVLVEIDNGTSKMTRITGTNGKANFELEKIESSGIKGLLLSVPYGKQYFGASLAVNTLLDINFKPKTGQPIYKQIDTLQIIDRTSNEIKLKNKSGDTIIWSKAQN